MRREEKGKGGQRGRAELDGGPPSALPTREDINHKRFEDSRLSQPLFFSPSGMVSPMKQIAADSGHFLSRLERFVDCSAPHAVSTSPAPLHLALLDIRQDLRSLHIPTTVIAPLADIWSAAQSHLQQTCSQHYLRAWEGVCASPAGGLQVYYQQALQQRFESDFCHHRALSRTRMLAEVQAAMERVAAAASAEQREGGRGSFTEEALHLLELAFQKQQTLTRGERRTLAEATGLGEKQIATWVSPGPFVSAQAFR